MVTCCYWHEMARARMGSLRHLDERCLEGAALTLWAKSGIRNDAYPAVVPREIRHALLRTTSLRIEAKPYRFNARNNRADAISTE